MKAGLIEVDWLVESEKIAGRLMMNTSLSKASERKAFIVSLRVGEEAAPWRVWFWCRVIQGTFWTNQIAE